MNSNNVKLNVIALNRVYLNVATLGVFDIGGKGGTTVPPKPDTPEGYVEFLVDEGTFLVDEGAFLVLS